MTSKYYAVYEGRAPGVYTSWPEAKAQVDGYGFSIYKSFTNYTDMLEWLSKNIKASKKSGKKVPSNLAKLVKPETTHTVKKPVKHVHHTVVKPTSFGTKEENCLPQGSEISLYTDGSYDKYTRRYAWAYVLISPEGRLVDFGADSQLAGRDNMWQVSGEIQGVIRGLEKASKLGYHSIDVEYDLINLQKWGDDEWQAKKPETMTYKQFIGEMRDNGTTIVFTKIKSHTGNEFNEVCDMLVKRVLGIKKVDNMDAIPKEFRDLLKEGKDVN